MPLMGLSALLLASVAAAGSRGGAWTSMYLGDDRVQVLTSNATARTRVRAAEIEVGYDVDVISAASVDVVTAASPRGYEETRHGGSVGVTLRPSPTWTLGARALASLESDYRSLAAPLSASAEWLERRLTTRVQYRLTLDSVGRSGSTAEWRSLRSDALFGEVGVVLDRASVATLSYEGQLQRGFQASPYRFVRVEWTGLGQPIAVPEALPETRVRHAAALGARRALSDSFFARASYRFYWDSWEVRSHTAEAGLEFATRDDALVLGVSARGYTQGAAAFHQERYVVAAGELPRYREVDKLLAASWSLLPALRVELSPEVGRLHSLRLTGKVELLEQRFLLFPLLKGRRALIFSLGAEAEL
jgi:hypothetical protein